MKILFGEPYEIKWTDPHRYGDWQTLSAVRDESVGECRTFGLIMEISSDPKYGKSILVVPTDATKSDDVLCPIRIPVSNLLSIQKMKTFGKVWKQGEELYGD